LVLTLIGHSFERFRFLVCTSRRLRGNALSYGFGATPAILLTFTIVPLALTTNSLNPITHIKTPQKFTSNTFLASSRSVSRNGITRPEPALLMRTSSVPPVCFATALAAASMEAWDVVSRVRILTFGCEESESAILEVLRAVAKTRKPRRAKAMARLWPMLPWLQPVMRTDFCMAIP
jgi:hypothetical protein